MYCAKGRSFARGWQRLLAIGGLFSALLLGLGTSQADAITPGDPGMGDVAFTINASAGTQPISPRIYGINGELRPSGLGNGGTGGLRLGGNRWTGYNWETNSSNAGEDFFNYSDGFLVDFQSNTPPGQAVLPTLQEAAAFGGVTNVTVPIAGYVAADDNQEVFANQTAPSSRWNEVRAKKSSIYPGSSLSLNPDKNDSYVFTDDFVNWVESNRQSGQEVMYSLDNEPGLWEDTHPRLWGTTNPTFAEYGARAIAHASAIKDVAPNAKVLGGVTFGWEGMRRLSDAPDFESQVPGPREPDGLYFNRYLLETMAAEEARQGRPLMDVLDIHWYPEARGDLPGGGDVRITAGGELNNSPGVVEARVQAPRSLWDPTYVESSYITQFSTQGEGIDLLNRVQADIDELKPGTLLSVAEYNYGGGNHISGGIAQADVLGIFGREGVFNASRWPIEPDGQDAYAAAGFEMFLDFDGQGGQFGDLSLEAETDSIAESSVYASRSTTNADEMVIVAINRTDGALDAAIQITDDQQYTIAEVYQLTGASATPLFAGQFSAATLNAFLYEMPAFSVSTIRLTAAGLAGDFNGDGTVDAADYTTWRSGLGITYTEVDYQTWRTNYGATIAASSTTTIPEPQALVLFLLAAHACCIQREWSKIR